jgi:uncharacterized protein
MKRSRGFAAMNLEEQRASASLGGQAAHEQGKAHEFTRQEARHAGQIGGWVISRDRQHMARIGQKGAIAKQRSRAEKEKK